MYAVKARGEIIERVKQPSNLAALRIQSDRAKGTKAVGAFGEHGPKRKAFSVRRNADAEEGLAQAGEDCLYVPVALLWYYPLCDVLAGFGAGVWEFWYRSHFSYTETAHISFPFVEAEVELKQEIGTWTTSRHRIFRTPS
jgi:hypothetical protein